MQKHFHTMMMLRGAKYGVNLFGDNLTLFGTWVDNGDGSYTLTGDGSYDALRDASPEYDGSIFLIEYTVNLTAGVLLTATDTLGDIGPLVSDIGVSNISFESQLLNSRLDFARSGSGTITNATVSNIRVRKKLS